MHFDVGLILHHLYCKTLIIRVTLFSRGQQPTFIHETLSSRFVIYSYIIFALEIISEDFILRLYAVANLRKNKKCFTVYN